jgi:molybdopterin synthase catalytic subunit
MSQRLGEIGIDEMVFQCVEAGPSTEDVVEGLRITIDTLKPFTRADQRGTS